MAAQETLPGTGEPTFNPLDHTLWKRFVGSSCDCKPDPHQPSHGHVNHGQWLRARAENQWVGNCRRCGDYLVPQPPEQVSAQRTDYEARCQRAECGWTLNLPGGRYLTRSSRQSERPTTTGRAGDDR